MKQTIYPAAEEYRFKKAPQWFARTGEKRNPRKGEWYLSGAIPEAYLSPSTLGYPYHILTPVSVRPCTHCEGTGRTAEVTA